MLFRSGLYVRMAPVFHNPAFFPQGGEARTGPLDLLARAARAQVEIVLADLAPDVLGLLDEPTAAADNADLPDLAKPEALGGFLDAVTRDLVHNGTSLAVGLGSWEEPELAAVLAAAPGVELLDIHVSALRSRQTDFLVQADEYAQMAQLLGKRAALGAVWLSKSSSFTLSSRRARWLPADQDIVRLDVYGFWSPLDAAFLRLMARLARARDLEFLCPASSAPLFTYLEYDSHMERTAYPALARFFERAVYQEARAEHLSRTGRVFRDIVRGVLP